MPASKDRFVTGCQQLLALGAVLAVLTPAARVITLDVVHEAPSGSAGGLAVEGHLPAHPHAPRGKSVVPAEVVEPVVTDYALTAPAHGRIAPSDLHARTKVRAGRAEIVAAPQPVSGYGAVGVTWRHGEDFEEDEISFDVRTETAGGWSTWGPLEYHDEHGPDPDSQEGRRARPGTEPLLVGEVDRVQVRVSSEAGVPADLQLAVVDPGEADEVTREVPELDTAGLDTAAFDTAGLDTAGAGTGPTTGTAADELELRAASYTPKPVIYSRAQWGANEKLRSGSPSYFEVHAGFVHHTVNANDYSRDEVPGILRSIYAYHTQSRGWSDVGYNYLVDRFGRIWEGRAGGIDRPVVGAHTLGYNEYSFAMSAIGNFDVVQPTSAMVQAYGALFAWKLSLHGVDASSASQVVGKKTFPAVNGHRDAGSTACPGKYLYAKIPAIRALAAGAQQGWSGRELESDLVGTPHPDLLVRNSTDRKAYVIPTGGLTGFRAARTVATGWTGVDTLVASPDLTGDGRADLLVRRTNGSTEVRPADGAGGFGEPVRPTGAFRGTDLITPVGDLDGDGDHDVVARVPSSGRLDLYLGDGTGRLVRRTGGAGWGGYDLLAGPGDVDRDGRADLLGRDRTGRMWLHRSTTGLSATGRTRVAGSWSGYASVSSGGDHNRDGIADLFAQRKDNGKGFVLTGRGDGTFGGPYGPVSRTKGLTGVSVGGDVAGGREPDLVARRGDDVVVVENAGTFETTAPIPTGVTIKNADVLLSAGDWDRDGLGDMITRNAGTGTLSLRRGDGQGRFSRATALAKGFGKVELLSAVGDMTGDGWPDLMGQPAGGAMRLYPGNGLQGLHPSYVAHGRISAARHVAVGRWDADGAPDSLFRSGDKLVLHPGNGPGGLRGPRSLGTDLAAYDWVIGVSDVQLTGHADVIVRSKADGRLWLLPGKTTGFGARRLLGEGMGVYDLAG